VYSNGDYVNSYNYAARPALYLDLDSSIFKSSDLPEGWQEMVASPYRINPPPPTVTFDPVGGAVSEPSRSVEYNTAVGELPRPTRDGYDFEAWYTLADGGEKVEETTVIKGNITFYAHWNPIPYTVTWNANGGAVSPVTITVAYGQAVGELPKPTRDGYDFKGWYTLADGGDQINEATVITADVTFYAHWTQTPTPNPPPPSPPTPNPPPSQFTVTFDPVGGVVSPASKTVNSSTAIGALPKPTRTGY
jgi:uncharacterized repeat protein (TIGR02543 family)